MRQRGFTLLEMMIAMGILAMSLVWLIEATTRAIAAENRAKLVGTATFLARARLVELEDELAEKGFADEAFGKETSGDFEERGFKRYRWTVNVDKVELPGQDQVQSMVSKAIEAKQQLSGGSSTDKPASGAPQPGGAGGLGGMGGAGAGMLSSQFGIVKDVLEQGIRRARVKISWEEGGKERSIEVVEYLTDPRRVDMAIQMPNLGAIPGIGGQPGVPGAPGTGAPGAPGGGSPIFPGGSAAPRPGGG